MRLKKLLCCLLIGVAVSVSQPVLAVENVSHTSYSHPAVEPGTALQLNQYLETLEKLLSSWQTGLTQGKTVSGLKTSLTERQNRLQDIQRQVVKYFDDNQLILKDHFSGSGQKTILSRHKDAKEKIIRQFENLHRKLENLKQSASLLDDIVILRREVQHFLTLKHQPLNTKQLPTAFLALPRAAIDKNFFTQLPPKPGLKDLAAAPEAPFSGAIKSLAKQLDNNPHKIYQWVYNNIKYYPGYGSWQGAELTLKNKAGNSWDQAALLIALLRKAGTPARYTYGQIQPTGGQLRGWLGVSSPDAAYQLLSQAGIAGEDNSLPHVWVSAYLADEARWVDLDPSFKQCRYQASAGDPQDEAWLRELLEFAQIGPVLPERPVLGKSRIIKKEVALTDGLAVDKYVCWGQSSQLPAELCGKLSFDLAGNIHSFTLREIARQPLSVVYMPAEGIDSDLIEYFNESRQGLAAHLIKLQPYLLLGTKRIELGGPVSMGTPQTLSITWELPGGGESQVNHLLLAGMNAVWAANWGQIPSAGKLLQPAKSTGIKEKFNAYIVESIKKEYNLQPLAEVALSYQRQNQRLGEVIARYGSYYFAPGISEGLVAFSAKVDFFFDQPIAFSTFGVQIDVQKDNFLLAGLEKKSSRKHFLNFKGALASALEHRVLESESIQAAVGSKSAVSAVKALHLALERGIPVRAVGHANFAEAVETLELPYAVREDLRQAVRADKIITLPQRVLQLDDWRGIGYIVTDKVGGQNAYMLTGGLGGGSSFGGSANTNLKIPYPRSTVGKIIIVVLVLGVFLALAL